MPFFSVIIPLYNKENYIGATLASALAQTFKDFEIIIVNDGSTDKGGEEVKKFSDNRIVYIETINHGVSSARNTGITMAQGEFVAFLDADDLWMPGHLRELYDLYNDFPEAGMLVSGYIIKYGNKHIKPVFKNVPEGYRGIINDPFEASLHYRLGLMQALSVPKKALETAGMFDPELSNMEDTDFWIRVVLQYPLAFTGKATVVYHCNVPHSLSQKNILERRIFDFSKFEECEKQNTSLKAFLDIYRVDYALKLRMAGNVKDSDKLFRAASGKNIPSKTKLLFFLPPVALKKLLQLKHWLFKRGVDFSIYN